MLRTTETHEAAMTDLTSRPSMSRIVLFTLLAANLASAGAAVMVNIFTAAYVKHLTGEAAWAATAIVMAYLPPLTIGSYLGGLIDRKLRRNGILAAELGSAAATLGCGVAVWTNATLGVILALLGVRSLLVAAVRNSLIRWLKLDAPETLQEGRIQLFIMTILLALPASGLAMTWASTMPGSVAVSITGVALIFHLIALCVITLLPARPPEVAKGDEQQIGGTKEGLLSTVRAILANRSLGLLFAACLFAQPVFQAAEQVLVAVKANSLGMAGMAHMQTVGGAGLLLGFGLLQLVRPRGISGFKIAMAVTFGIVSLLLTAYLTNEKFVLPAFLGMTFVYELLDSYFFGRFFKQSPPAHVARYSITVGNLGGALMSASAIGFGLAIDALGFGIGAILFVFASILYGIVLLLIATRFAQRA